MSDNIDPKTPGFDPQKDDIGAELLRFEEEYRRRVARLSRAIKILSICLGFVGAVAMYLLALVSSQWALR